MKITINNIEHEFEEHLLLENLAFQHLNLPPKGIAIAVNEVVIPRASWKETILRPTDSLLIIKASQGG